MKKQLAILASAGLGLLLLVQIGLALRGGAGSMLVVPVRNETVQIIDLGTLGGTASAATGLNAQGLVVGTSTISETETVQAFLWDGEMMEQLSVAGDLVTQASAVNALGQVVGAAVTGPIQTTDQRPVLWQDNSYVPLELDNTLFGSAKAINDAGLIAGQTLGQVPNQLILWQENKLTSTVPISAGVALVYGINNLGQVVGQVTDGSDQQAFLWQEDEMTFLPSLGGPRSVAHDINEIGLVAGASTTAEDQPLRATIWVAGLPADLGTLDEEPEATSRALGLNSKGLVVGEASYEGVSHAVVWSNGRIRDLNSLLPESSPWERLQTAVAINDAGWIAGTGLIAGQQHAFLLQLPTDQFDAYLPVIAKPESTPTPPPTPTSPSTPTPSPTPEGAVYDMRRFLVGDGRLYEVRFSGGPFDGSQARHQTQDTGARFYHTKGNEVRAEWEELWTDKGLVFRGTDTSPGGGLYYSLYAWDGANVGPLGSAWSPRLWREGGFYLRQPFVIFFQKANCQIAGSGYVDKSWLKFERYYPSYQFSTLDQPLQNVVQLAWFPNRIVDGVDTPGEAPIERYYYAEDYGLVGWRSLTQGLSSGVSEIHAPGTRPDNTREVIPCLQQGLLSAADMADLNMGPLPEPYASMVRP